MMTDQWAIIRCKSGQEVRAERYLERMGYPDGWHPVEKVRTSPRAYQRALAAWRQAMETRRKPQTHKTRPLVHGYVFAPIPKGGIDPARIKHSPFAIWMEVLCVNDAPYTVTSEAMAAMRQIPERLKEMIDVAEYEAQQRRLEDMPVVGEMAIVADGPFQGRQGVVHLMDKNAAEIDLGLAIGCVSLPLASLQRVRA